MISRINGIEMRQVAPNEWEFTAIEGLIRCRIKSDDHRSYYSISDGGDYDYAFERCETLEAAATGLTIELLSMAREFAASLGMSLGRTCGNRDGKGEMMVWPIDAWVWLREQQAEGRCKEMSTPPLSYGKEERCNVCNGCGVILEVPSVESV